jgi:cell division protein FtsQ
LERVKPMQRNSSAAAAADQEAYRPELIADEEPRYLRRQKPVEIRRKKLGGKAWPFYRRVFLWAAVGGAMATAGTFAVRNLLYSPQMLLLKPDQIDVNGNHVVQREEVLKLFVRDRNRSVLRIPLDERRAQLREISWVEEVSVQRILPNRLRVEITERTPIAFFRNGTELTLIDSHGVLLDRPDGEDFHFPIITGLSENTPREEREKRMQTYQEFVEGVDLVKPGSSDNVSELDLANPRDLKAVIAGLSPGDRKQAVTVHFGQNDFTGKYKTLVDNFAQWQANAGRVQSIDLQYARQVVVNPDTDTPTPREEVASRRR